MGKRLISELLKKGCKITALVRSGSEKKLPAGCAYVIGNAFHENTFADKIPSGATFIQLLGVAHPGPSKKEQFKSIDLASAIASAKAAKLAGVKHFIYVSVAQTPVSIMQAYQQCRAEGEAAILKTNIPATFIRPWYVIGPGHYWPLLFAPVFKILEWIPSTSKKAKALRLVTIKQMIRTLVNAAENIPAAGVNFIEIENIRKSLQQKN